MNKLFTRKFGLDINGLKTIPMDLVSIVFIITNYQYLLLF